MLWSERPHIRRQETDHHHAHTTPKGHSKIVPECNRPLTAMNIVDMIVTDLAVFEFRDGKLYITELMPGATIEEVREKTITSFVDKHNK